MNNSMNRRGFFNMGAKVALGAAVVTSLGSNNAHAEETEVVTEISNNHGHELKLSLAEVVALLRKLEPEPEMETADDPVMDPKIETLSIQGQSHPHSIDLMYEDVLDVLLGKDVIVESTIDFSHSHEVRLVLEV